MKDIVCESIGNTIWEMRLVLRYIYEDFRRTKGFGEFDTGVGKMIERPRSEWKASPEYQAIVAQKKDVAEKYKKQREDKRKLKFDEHVAKQYKVNPSVVQVCGDGCTLTTEGRAFNNGKNGHQKRINISLANLQITVNNYFQPPPSSHLSLPHTTNEDRSLTPGVHVVKGKDRVGQFGLIRTSVLGEEEHGEGKGEERKEAEEEDETKEKEKNAIKE
jgi:hypothetical protein